MTTHYAAIAIAPEVVPGAVCDLSVATAVVAGFLVDSGGVEVPQYLMTDNVVYMADLTVRTDDNDKLTKAPDEADQVLAAAGWVRTGGWDVADVAMYAPVRAADQTPEGTALAPIGVHGSDGSLAYVDDPMPLNVKPFDEQYTVVIRQVEQQGGNIIRQHLVPAENATFDGTPDELAAWVAGNQTVAEDPGWEVCVWLGHDADTGVEPAAVAGP